MRHLEIRDLWLQKEVADGKLKVFKELGSNNPADLMTKILTRKEIEHRIGLMGMKIRYVERFHGIKDSEGLNGSRYHERDLEILRKKFVGWLLGESISTPSSSARRSS